MKIRVKTILIYFYFYFIIFGPKYGLIDLSLCTSLIVLLYLMFTNSVSFSKKIVYLFISVIVILVYSSLVGLVCMHIDFIFIAKFIRCAVSILSISAVITTYKLKTLKVINIILNILLLHALIVIISSVFFVELQNYLKIINNFSLQANSFRSPGLTNGYDFSGVLCIFGMLITVLLPENIIKNKIVKIIIFICASLLTSRINMLFLELIFLYFVFVNKKIEKKYKILFIMLIGITIIPILGLFLYSTGYKDNIIIEFLLKNQYFADISKKIVYYYATSDINGTIHSHFNFNKLTELELIFGSMKIANQDPGYTQYIYQIGFLGLIITFIPYFLIIYECCMKKNKIKVSMLDCLTRLIIMMILICFALSFKNSYLLARHVTEIIIILYILFVQEQQKVRLGEKA